MCESERHLDLLIVREGVRLLKRREVEDIDLSFDLEWAINASVRNMVYILFLEKKAD